MQRIWQKHYGTIPAEVSDQGTIVDLLHEAVAKWGDKPAFHGLHVDISFNEVDALSRDVAAWLQAQGMKKGDRVAVMMPNLLVHPVISFGIIRAGGVQVNVNDNYLFTAKTTSNGYLEVVGRDHPAQDKPGYLTTTLRVYGNVAAYRTGSGSIELTSRFTCSGVGISGLTVGSGGASVSGGVTSSTLTWRSSRTSSTEVRQAYTEGGHFRCTASNAGPAKFTRRASALTSYKTGDTRAESSYSFWW